MYRLAPLARVVWLSKPSHTVATVLMSGGIDSTACAHFLREQGMRVRGLFIDHGQAAAAQEAIAVRAVASALEIEISSCKLSSAAKLGTGELVGRNSMLIFAGLFFDQCQPSILALGIHAGTEYFDCSPAFLQVAARLLSDQTDGRVSLVAPFSNWAKQDVIEYSVTAGLPLHLTYSCEAGRGPGHWALSPMMFSVLSMWTESMTTLNRRSPPIGLSPVVRMVQLAPRSAIAAARMGGVRYRSSGCHAARLPSLRTQKQRAC